MSALRLTDLMDLWDAWSADRTAERLDLVRVRDIEQGLLEAAQARGILPDAQRWSLFFGLLIWRELGSAAPLVQTLLPKFKSIKRGGWSLLNFQTRHRPRGEAQRKLRKETLHIHRAWWTWWWEKPQHYELVDAATRDRWASVPELLWLFEGKAFQRCPPLKGETVLLNVCQDMWGEMLVA